jgi:hypothetical protein
MFDFYILGGRDMRSITSFILRSAIIAVVMVTVGIVTAQAQGSGSPNKCPRVGRGLNIIALTDDQRLICFRDSRPSMANTIGKITGLAKDETTLIGIDFRVQDGNLYGVGNAGGVYRLNTTNAVATLVNSLTVPLDGTSFGVDFNPAADRLRVVSNKGQNLRHNVNAGGVTINDGVLSYTAPDAAMGITGAAYTNNDLDPNTGTTLFDIDTVLDQVALQSPANSGTLAATGKLTVEADSSAGFDIHTAVRSGITVNEGFAALRTPSNSIAFYSITLFTGKATIRGEFSSTDRVTDIAIPLGQR